MADEKAIADAAAAVADTTDTKAADKEKAKKAPAKPKAKQVLKFDIRFTYDYPAFSVEYASSNNNLVIKDWESTPFGAKFMVINLTEEDQILQGSVQDADPQNMFIFGRALHPGKEGQVEKTIGGVPGTDDTVDISSDWIQDRDSAEAIADWVVGRLSEARTKISVKLVGTPLIEVGDIVTVRHSELSLTEDKRFLVNKVNVSWKEGLETDIEAIEI